MVSPRGYTKSINEEEFRKHFVVGDWIVVDDYGTRGVITAIGRTCFLYMPESPKIGQHTECYRKFRIYDRALPPPEIK